MGDPVPAQGDTLTLRERLAVLAHDQWSGWMQHVFNKGTLNPDGTMTIPAWAVTAWSRQVKSKYEELDLREKSCDLVEADRMISVFNGNPDPDPFER